MKFVDVSSVSGGREPGDGAQAVRPFGTLYERGVDDLLDVEVEETWVEPRAGRTHVLLAGPADAPPAVEPAD